MICRLALLPIVLAGTVCVTLPAVSQGEPSPPYLERDRDDLVRLLTGTWSNDRQVFFADEAGYDANRVAPLQTLVLEPEEARPGALVSRRGAGSAGQADWVYVFRVDGGSGNVVQDILLPDGTSSGCAVWWTRAAGSFAGAGQGEGCEGVFPAQEADGLLQVNLTLSSTELHIRAARGGLVSDTQMRRARPFVCWAGVLKGASHGDSGSGPGDWDFRRDVSLHDQGGEAVIETAETPPRRVRLKLRDVDWPYGDRRPSLTLYIHEGDDARAVSYAWAEGGADRIGINLRWMQASCTRAGTGS